jgi:hypothetical protein
VLSFMHALLRPMLSFVFAACHAERHALLPAMLSAMLCCAARRSWRHCWARASLVSAGASSAKRLTYRCAAPYCIIVLCVCLSACFSLEFCVSLRDVFLYARVVRLFM